MHPDLSCNHARLLEHCAHLVKKGCQGVVLFGTTGEGASFSAHEKIETLSLITSKGFDPQNIIIGNGSACIPDSIQIALASVHHQCLACLISPPCYYKNNSEEGIINYYREIIRGTKDPSLKIIVYHIPQLTGVPITANILLQLVNEFPETIIGLKDSEGNDGLIDAILKEAPAVKVFTGKEKKITALVQKGGAGGISGMANLWPELICSLYLNDSRLGEYNEKYAHTHTASFIPLAKNLLAVQGDKAWKQVRPPLVQFDDNSQANVT